MPITYASKASSKVVERFRLKALSAAFVNHDYEWSGADTVNAFSFPTTALGNYSLTGDARYGASVEQQNTVQTMLVTQDKAFNINIDKRTMQDTPIAAITGKVLSGQVDEQFIPLNDTYTFGVIAAAAIAAGGTAIVAVTAANAYSMFLNAMEYLGNNKVPVTGLKCACSFAYFKFIKSDPSFVLNSDLGQKIKITGQIGEVDGVPLVPVPSSYLPAGVAFIIAHPSATVGVNKLEDLTTHLNPPGLSGAKIEGRFRFDSFVLTAKNVAVYAHKII